MKKNIFVLGILLLGLLVLNYFFLDSLLINFFDEKEHAIVERVIDGDTVVVDGSSVRLLGINVPERGENYYEEAKNFLEEQVLNKSVKLKFGKDEKDRYNRTLAYIFVGEENINLEMVKEGFANAYFPSGKDEYYEEFQEAWEGCSGNLCEKSESICASCIGLKSFDYKKEEVIFHNRCGVHCEMTNWEIRDEGRKNFYFPKFVLEKEKEVKIIVSKENKTNDGNDIFWNRKDYVWTDSGDTLFLRDGEGKLVLWENY